jgi:hypothetical protein
MRHALGLAPLSSFVIVAACAVSVVTPRIARAQAPAAADEPTGDAAAMARQRFNAGAVAYQQKRFVEAALNFEAASAAAEKANAIALVSAAQAWELADQPPRAADDFARAIAAGLPGDRLPNAKDRLATLQGLLGRVEVTAPDGWRVQLDAFTEVPAPATLHGAAGMHTLSVRAPGRAIDKREVVLSPGKATLLELKDAPPPDAKEKKEGKPVIPPPVAPTVVPPTKPDDSSGAKLRRSVGLVSIGVGASALLGGVIFGLSALDAKDAYNAAPSRAAFDHAGSLSTWTNVMLIGGGVFAATGVVLVLWPSSKTEAQLPTAAPATTEGDAAPGASSERSSSSSSKSLVLVPTLGGAIVRGTF